MESISHNYEKYLQSGKKTTLSNKRKNFFKEKFKGNDNLLNTIYTRKQEYFDQETHSKGNNIGKVDVNQILEADKNETGRVPRDGCHSEGIIIASILRLYGIPTIMVDTALVSKTIKGKTIRGHVFLEIYIDGKRKILNPGNNEIIDSWGDTIIEDKKGHKYYILKKGIDPDDYGIHSKEELNKLIISKMFSIKLSSLVYSVKKKIIEL